jgi:putative tryptophan/tyrosine transport system substrate-binding protein
MTSVIDRRTFLAGTGATLVAAPLAAEAQQAGKVPRIGVLLFVYAPDADPPQAFRQRLRDLGYVEGQNIVIDWRWVQGKPDRLPDLAVELVRLKPDVVVADFTQSIRAAMHATSTIPIVMMGSADAVGGGLVSNLAHPGGNVTGLSILMEEMSPKRLQLLKETAPRISRVAVLWNPATPWHKPMLKDIDAAAPGLGLHPVTIAVRSRDDFGNAFSEITKAHVDALFVNETMTPPARAQLIDFAAKKRLPTMFMNRDYVTAGGLMSYAPDYPEMYRHAADYVDKILKGAKPGDLPVEQPTKFELVINLKTARALGLTIPPSLLQRADEVIQ